MKVLATPERGAPADRPAWLCFGAPAMMAAITLTMLATIFPLPSSAVESVRTLPYTATTTVAFRTKENRTQAGAAAPYSPDGHALGVHALLLLGRALTPACNHLHRQ